MKNKLFKERLKDTGISIVALIIIVAIIAAAISVFFLIIAGLEWIWKPLDDIVFGGLIASYILYHVWQGFKWLFIDPFRKAKEEAEEKEAVESIQWLNKDDDEDED